MKLKKISLILVLLILFAAFVCTTGVASAITLDPIYVGNTVVDLGWSKYGSEDFSCYKLYRNDSQNATISDRNTTFYRDTGPSKGVTYYYKIEAYNRTGVLRDYSFSQAVTTGKICGTITRDTTWGATYNLLGVAVAEDVTLTISGATVKNGGEYSSSRIYVGVNGSLSSESATFDAVGIQGERGSRHLSVRDCLLYNDSYLQLFGNDSSVIGNTLTNGDGYIRVCGNNNTIKDNILNNTYGISVEGGNHMVAGNTLSGVGISLLHAYNNMIMGNIVSNESDWHGITIDDGCYNTVAGNIISNGSYYGIDIGCGIENIIKDNIVSNNSCGIRVGGDYNTIYNNYFDNEDNVDEWEMSRTHIWNITKTPGTNIVGGHYLGGNYWSDYTGTDADGDGLGDTPYMISGVFRQDYLPLVKSEPEPKPTISIYTDKTSYAAGEKMHLGLDVKNPLDSAQTVRLNIYLEMPTGGTFTLMGTTVTLPAGLDYCNPDFKVFPLPTIPTGTYTWHAILADPVTGTIISESEAKWEFVGACIAEPIAIEEIAKTFPPITETIEFEI